MFFDQKDVNFALYVDDNTPYFCDKNLYVLLNRLQICALKLLEWFSNNYMKMNSDKCHLILSSQNKKIELNEQVINNTQVQKLGVHIHYKLKFDTHTEILRKKVEKKLHALAQNYKVNVYKPSTTYNEKFYNVAIQLLSTHLDVS